jgi:hypothetical protein
MDDIKYEGSPMRWLRKNGFWIFALILLVLAAFLVNRARLP